MGKETIKLPNLGCSYVRTRYDSERDAWVVEYEQRPGFHPQVICDTGIPLPTEDPNKIRYERVKAVSSPLEAISNSPDIKKAAREYIDRITAIVTARANDAQRKFLEGLKQRVDKLESGELKLGEIEPDDLTKELLEDLQSEPMPTPEELARYEYMRKDVVDHLLGKDKKKPKGKKGGKQNDTI
jgi:hypothetical protein